MKRIGWILILCLMLPLSNQVMGGEDTYSTARQQMVTEQIKARGVSDQAVLTAMNKVPRHLFVPEAFIKAAYMDQPLPIGHGQTISQPYIVGYMTEVLRLTGKEKVLEIGTGSGYQAAILAETAKEVYSVEIIPELYAIARDRLTKLGYDRVQVKAGDGYYGWSEKGPFDAIVVTCAAGHIPPPMIEQLKPGGKMVIPVGRAWGVQTLVLAEKDQEGKVKTRSLFHVRFVPLIHDEESK